MMNKMQGFVVYVLLMATALLGMDGKIVYETKCASCHTMFVPMSQLEKNFMEMNNTLLNLKAPTINQVVYRLKTRIGDPNGDEDIHRMEVESFLEEYFANPDKQKSICLPEILNHFETMPPVTNLTEEEFEAIVTFLYEYDPKSYQAKTLRYRGFEEAVAQAKKEGKILMVFYSAEHCRYCKKMEHEVMSDDVVIETLEKEFVTVNVDMDREKSPISFAPTMTPTFLFLGPQQEIVYQVPGSWGKEDFLEILREAKEKYEIHLKKGEKQ